MSVFIAKTRERFSFFSQIPPAAFLSGSRPAIFTVIQAHVEFYLAPVFWIIAFVALVSATAYVVSMNIILFEERRAASFERVLIEGQRDRQALFAERAALGSPSAVKERAAAIGMTEAPQIRFVSEEEVIAAKGRQSGDSF